MIELWEKDDEGKAHPSSMLQEVIRWTQGDYEEGREAIEAMIPYFRKAMLSRVAQKAAADNHTFSVWPGTEENATNEECEEEACRALEGALETVFGPDTQVSVR